MVIYSVTLRAGFDTNTYQFPIISSTVLMYKGITLGVKLKILFKNHFSSEISRKVKEILKLCHFSQFITLQCGHAHFCTKNA